MYYLKKWFNRNIFAIFRLDIYPEFFGGNKRKADLIRNGNYEQAMREDVELLRETDIGMVVNGERIK